MANEKVNWGGRREGSGRKRSNPEDKKVQFTVTLSPESKEKLKRIAKKEGKNMSNVLDGIIKNLPE